MARLFHTLRLRFRSIFQRSRVEQELDEELQFHVERLIDEGIARGMDPVDARFAALRAMGGVEQRKEQCRDRRRVSGVDHLGQDLRFGFRMIRRNPGFSCVVIAILGGTMGAIATIFTLAHALYFRDLPVNRPGELVAVSPTRRHGAVLGSISYPDYVRLRDATRSLSEFAAHYSTAPLSVTANGVSREMNGAVVSANYFQLLGLKPAIGRFFQPDEDRVTDRDRVAVLGYELWRTSFGASPAAVGVSLKINGVPFTVVGVAPETFRGIASVPNELFIPTMMLRAGYRWCEDSLARDCTILDMIGRLAAGRRIEDVRAEMASLIPAEWARAPEGENTGLRVDPPRGMPRDSDDRRFLGLLAGVVAVLLLVCCANVAGLLLARTSSRAHEIATRTSLGATRGRVVRQLITESVVLSLIGASGGVLASLALARWINASFYAVDSEGHPLNVDFSVDPRVVVAVFGVSCVAGVLFGLFSALRSTSAATLHKPVPTVTRRARAGEWLVGMQAAVAVTLVAIAAMLSVSARAMLAGTNFETAHVALMRLRPRLIRYPPQRAGRFLRDAVAALESVPGVESVTMVGNGVALRGSAAAVALPGSPLPAEDATRPGYIEIGTRYFQTLRTPVLRGREFDDHDSIDSPPVALVNETLARRMWPRGDAIGATLIVNRRPREVVGIVADVPLHNRMEAPRSYVYVPFWQRPGQIDARLCLRVAGDPAAMLPALERAVHAVDPDVPVAETITLPMQMAGEFRPLRVAQTYVIGASALALLLSAVGLYASVAFAVAMRTREIGIRKAIGARSRVIARMVFREGMTPIVAGATAGMAFAPVCARMVRHLLYGPAIPENPVYVAAALVVATVATVACWIPARRAASIDPMVALRCE